ncbi:hypothetical protein C8A01DRAFT_50827 [Parachaetomium inaequale]|uniref:Uncharacterized protein n=1 Tax=Parachaetomium inaequale TaxID=2588326 RepID=A0AAN6P7R8_9PEZI|nr:hypothetical protein C8A01DRAFT_50827 [Parachaetomium inaequale]
MDNNGDPDADRGSPCRGPVDALSCVNPQCRRREGMLKAEIDRLNARIQQLEDEAQAKSGEIRQLSQDKRVLNEENDTLKAKLAGRGKHTKRTWPEVLRTYLRNSHPDRAAYAKIHRQCCKEENMSTRLELVHPDIKFVAPRRRRREPPDSEDDASNADDDAPELPCDVQAIILKLVLYKAGQIIHCISRLDPFVQPEEIPSDEDLGEHRSGLINRFFWGERECSLSGDGIKPNDLLSLLSVNKRLHFVGVHIFYGLNTFAFSSLGELGRFCQGLGTARVARIQHVEFLLTGNQYLTTPLDTRRKVPFSRRSFPLTWLADMYRLKTLVIHVNETGKAYVRRGTEHPDIKRFLAAKTAGQPNRRTSRSLRCLQGVDYICQLRGLAWMRWYDFNKSLRGRSREPIQDWSFMEDVVSTATLPKPPKRAESSELEKLESLFPGEEQTWTPGPDDWELAKSVFIDSNGRCSYDDLRISQQNRDADLGSYLSAGGTVLDISSDSSSDSDSPSDSGSSVLSPGRRRRLRSASPMSISSSSSDSVVELSSDDESDSGSDPDSSDSDAATSSRRSFSDILSAHLSSRSPSSRLSRSPVRNSPPLNPARQTPGTHGRRCPGRRESTTNGLFVTPGPSNRRPKPDGTPNGAHNTTATAPRGQNQVQADGQDQADGQAQGRGTNTNVHTSPPARDTDTDRARREPSPASSNGLFVTPEPSGGLQLLPKPEEQGTPLPRSLLMLPPLHAGGNGNAIDNGIDNGTDNGIDNGTDNGTDNGIDNSTANATANATSNITDNAIDNAIDNTNTNSAASEVIDLTLDDADEPEAEQAVNPAVEAGGDGDGGGGGGFRALEAIFEDDSSSGEDLDDESLSDSSDSEDDDDDDPRDGDGGGSRVSFSRAGSLFSGSGGSGDTESEDGGLGSAGVGMKRSPSRLSRGRKRRRLGE